MPLESGSNVMMLLEVELSLPVPGLHMGENVFGELEM